MAHKVTFRTKISKMCVGGHFIWKCFDSLIKFEVIYATETFQLNIIKNQTVVSYCDYSLCQKESHSEFFNETIHKLLAFW
jgi:hypothetical protein